MHNPATFASGPRPVAQGVKREFNVEDHSIVEPIGSLYGNISCWDLLWLGHCGCRFPRASDQNVPLGRAVMLNDTTVPRREDLDMEFGNNEVIEQYPVTRVSYLEPE